MAAVFSADHHQRSYCREPCNERQPSASRAAKKSAEMKGQHQVHRSRTSEGRTTRWIHPYRRLQHLVTHGWIRRVLHRMAAVFSADHHQRSCCREPCNERQPPAHRAARKSAKMKRQHLAAVFSADHRQRSCCREPCHERQPSARRAAKKSAEMKGQHQVHCSRTSGSSQTQAVA